MWRLAILAALLAAWEFLPAVELLQGVAPVFDEFFVSSPSSVTAQIVGFLLRGDFDFASNLMFTFNGLVLGFTVGTSLAIVAALVLTNSRLMSAAFTPILDLVNAVPTITVIPLVVLMFGATLTTSVLVAAQSVFFFVFFNAYGGGASMPPSLRENAMLLGATGQDVMWRIRARFVIAWTVEVAPAAIGRALTATFTAELFSGSAGLGRLVRRALLTINADLTFAIVVVLSVIGVVLSGVVTRGSRHYLHWWTTYH